MTLLGVATRLSEELVALELWSSGIPAKGLLYSASTLAAPLGPKEDEDQVCMPFFEKSG